MKRLIFALGILFLFACTKKDKGQSPLPIVSKEESIAFTTNLDTGKYNVADTLPLIISISSKLPSNGILFSITATWTDSSKQIYKLDTTSNSSNLNLNLPGLKFTGNYSINITLTSKSTSSNTTNKSISVINNPLGRAIKSSDGTFEIVPVDELLKSNNSGVIKVPVIILNYLPTADGILLDRYKTHNSVGVYDANQRYTLDRAKQKILTEKIIEKNYIEQGTKFHDYGTNTVKPYINIDVVAFINVSKVNYILNDSSMVDTVGNGNKVKMYFYKIDFNELLTRINLKNYVENLGVKEVWFTSFVKEIGDLSYNVPESNMAGPYGNISNGGTPTIPTYNKTYVMYGFNGWRGVDTDLHNRGHQIERQMMEMDMTTWLNFTKGNAGIITHWAPNSLKDYEYGNKASAKSDIETWKLSGGTFVDVNVYTWLNKSYAFENKINMISPAYNATVNIDYNKDISYPNANQMMGATTEIKYHVYWWQSMPGYNNNVLDNIMIGGVSKNIGYTNWWDIFYNWDDAKRNKTKLYFLK